MATTSPAVCGHSIGSIDVVAAAQMGCGDVMGCGGDGDPMGARPSHGLCRRRRPHRQRLRRRSMDPRRRHGLRRCVSKGPPAAACATTAPRAPAAAWAAAAEGAAESWAVATSRLRRCATVAITAARRLAPPRCLLVGAPPEPHALLAFCVASLSPRLASPRWRLLVALSASPPPRLRLAATPNSDGANFVPSCSLRIHNRPRARNRSPATRLHLRRLSLCETALNLWGKPAIRLHKPRCETLHAASWGHEQLDVCAQGEANCDRPRRSVGSCNEEARCAYIQSCNRPPIH